MTDEQIIEMYFSRNEAAIKATSDKYSSYCYKIADNILKNHSDSDECVNDTWLKTWNSIPPHRPNIFSAFLAKITRNIALNMIKYQSAEKRNIHLTVALTELGECLAGTDSPSSAVEQRELSKAINDFVGSLNETDRRVFVRRYFFADDISAIGKKYGLSENNVYVILSRTRKKLRDYLTEEGYLIES